MRPERRTLATRTVRSGTEVARAALIGLAFALVALTGCADPGARSPTLDAKDTVPALAWLRANRNPSALATNRFGPTSAAIAFVEQLHEAGAVQVYVAEPLDEPERIADEGGPYADTLVVELPRDPAQRARLFEVIAREAVSEGFDPPRDRGQSTEMLWWD